MTPVRQRIPNHAIFWPVCVSPMSSKCADLRRPVAGGHSRTPFGYLGVKLSLPTVDGDAAPMLFPPHIVVIFSGIK